MKDGWNGWTKDGRHNIPKSNYIEDIIWNTIPKDNVGDRIKNISKNDKGEIPTTLGKLQDIWDGKKKDFQGIKILENIGKKVVPGGGFVAGSQKGRVIEFDKMKELARAREVEGEERGLLWNIHINEMTPGSVQDWINLYKLYRYYQDKSPEEEDHPGALVHCLAGFGRTGTTLLFFS